jgi:hypothetical protein
MYQKQKSARCNALYNKIGSWLKILGSLKYTKRTAQASVYPIAYCILEKFLELEVTEPMTLDLPSSPGIAIVAEGFSDCQRKVVLELEKAAAHSTIDAGMAMIPALIEAFQSGDHAEFKKK